MKEKIAGLKEIMENIDTLIWMLEGNSSKSMLRDGGTVKAETHCYRSEGVDLQKVIDSIIEEHGAEMLPTED